MTVQPQRLSGCGVLPPRMQIGGPETQTDGSSGGAPPPKRMGNRRIAAERFAVLNTFVDCTLAALKGNEIAVWLVLYRDTRNGMAQTSQTDIARRVGITDRTVRNVIRRLERRGLLKTVYQGGLNRGASRYQVIPQEIRSTT